MSMVAGVVRCVGARYKRVVCGQWALVLLIAGFDPTAYSQPVVCNSLPMHALRVLGGVRVGMLFFVLGGHIQ